MAQGEITGQINHTLPCLHTPPLPLSQSNDREHARAAGGQGKIHATGPYL